MPTMCPSCGHGLDVLRLGCGECGITLDGRFAFGRLGRLSKAQVEFVEIFLECRGKIKDVEQRLGVSYPTVVGRLDEVVAALGEEEEAEPAPERKAPQGAEPRPRRATNQKAAEILDALERGEITATEAAQRLRTEKGQSFDG